MPNRKKFVVCGLLFVVARPDDIGRTGLMPANSIGNCHYWQTLVAITPVTLTLSPKALASGERSRSAKPPKTTQNHPKPFQNPFKTFSKPFQNLFQNLPKPFQNLSAPIFAA
ncbi:MAG: hypothetical protein EOO15_05630 [Chitinophagaceae bacterium]|nr:MAG: hypothetical protein EOO15_05630 [Chitinophagaceae bacterium]